MCFKYVCTGVFNWESLSLFLIVWKTINVLSRLDQLKKYDTLISLEYYMLFISANNPTNDCFVQNMLIYHIIMTIIFFVLFCFKDNYDVSCLFL